MFDYTSLVTGRTGGEAYTAVDLNRINAALQDLSTRLTAAGYVVDLNGTADVSWQVTDWIDPTTARMILDNLREVRSKLTLLASTPRVPEGMEAMTHRQANDMEQILRDIDTVLRWMLPIRQPCGVYRSGAVIYPTR